MTFIDTLEGFEAALQKEKREERPKLDYLALKDGQSALIQPLQEIDPNSPTYDETKGRAFMIYVHQSPYNWKRRAQCTQESQGRCLGCELDGRDIDPKTKKPRAWYRRKAFFMNVVVHDHTGDPSAANTVKVLSTSGASPVVGGLLEFYKENGPLTEAVFKITRTGSGSQDTVYTLTPALRAEAKDLTDFEPQDTRAGGVVEIPYDRQAKFYEYVTKEEEAAVRESASIWD